MLRKQGGDLLASTTLPDGSARARLIAHLTGLARFSGSRKVLLEPYLTHLTSRAPDPDEDPLIASTAGLVAELVAEGGLREGIPEAFVPFHLVTTLIGRVLENPSGSPDDAARLAVLLVSDSA